MATGLPKAQALVVGGEDLAEPVLGHAAELLADPQQVLAHSALGERLPPGDVPGGEALLRE
jgi:hypothetical protein